MLLHVTPIVSAIFKDVKMKNSTPFINEHGGIQAILIVSDTTVDNIEFITLPENEIQVGLMKRDSSSPVKPHVHNPIKRTILSTQEFLWLRSGKMKVNLFNDEYLIQHSVILESGDAILLCSGAHSIEFLEPCQLLEIKQGPYLATKDKSYIDDK